MAKTTCTENYIMAAEAFLKGEEVESISKGSNINILKEHFRVMSVLSTLDTEPTRTEFIKISNDLLVSSLSVKICWRALIEAGFKPGEEINKPAKAAPTCKTRPKDIKTCSRLAYLSIKV